MVMGKGISKVLLIVTLAPPEGTRTTWRAKKEIPLAALKTACLNTESNPALWQAPWQVGVMDC